MLKISHFSQKHRMFYYVIAEIEVFFEGDYASWGLNLFSCSEQQTFSFTKLCFVCQEKKRKIDLLFCLQYYYM